MDDIQDGVTLAGFSTCANAGSVAVFWPHPLVDIY